MPVASDSSRPLVVQRTPGYRASRAAARRRRRRRLTAAAAILVLLAGAAVAAVRLWPARGPAHAAAGAAAPERTLLIGLTDAAGRTPAAALLAAAPAAGMGAEVLLPAGLIADAPGYGSQPIETISVLPDGSRVQAAAVSRLLSLRVDTVLSLSPAVFERLVSALGGLPMRVSAPLMQTGAGGRPVVAVPAGSVRLTGAQAWLYATYRAPAEDGQAPLPRLQAVLDAVLSRLPADAAGLRARLVAAGVPAGTAEAVAPVLAGLRGDVVSGHMLYTQLPVDSVDGGQSTPLYRVDPAGLAQMLGGGVLAGARLAAPTAGRRVLVEYGVGASAAGGSAASRLASAGFSYVGDQTLPAAERPAHSVVLVFHDTAAAQQLAVQLARTLGLPATAVAYSPRQQSVADMVVILGADYRP